jgi:hypothetical protein
LNEQGQMNQRVMFFSDGGTDIREVQLHLNPEAQHYLDWFHVTLRLTVMGQYLCSRDLSAGLEHSATANGFVGRSTAIRAEQLNQHVYEESVHATLVLPAISAPAQLLHAFSPKLRRRNFSDEPLTDANSEARLKASAKKLRIFVSSPGDVGRERDSAGRVLARLRAQYAGRAEIEPYFWEHEPMHAGADFQGQIPRCRNLVFSSASFGPGSARG